MANDQSSKRLMTTSGAGGESTCVNESSEIHALRSEVARLRQQLLCADDENARLREELLRSDAENARLLQQLQGLQGSHEALPVATLTSTSVDISRLDTSLVTLIVTFLGISLELRNLALTCKAFGWQQPATGQDLSLVEEAARQIVCSGKNDVEGVRVTLSPYVRGSTTWLSILRESEHPLKFDTLLGRGIKHTNESRFSVHGGAYLGTAVASNYVMISGIHYAEFLTARSHFGMDIGIVRPMPNLDPARFANGDFHFHHRSFREYFLAARTDEWGSGNVRVCYFNLFYGRMSWTNWAVEDRIESNWEGMEGCENGDTVGTLLDLDEGTLTVYKNNRRLGIMKDGLSGAYCWSCATIGGATITIERCDHPTE